MSARRLIALLLLFGLVLVAVVVWTSESREEVGVTRELAGRWVTFDERWAGRYLEITPNEIAFGQGEQGEARYRIVGVFRAAAESGAVYLIRYRGVEVGAEESELRVSVGPGELRLANQAANVRWVPAP